MAADGLPIDYSDYHRTVIGFHGTTAENAERLVDGDEFRASDQDNEWFGRGIYFWEHAHQQAWWWARRKSDAPAVVGAVIRLGNCFDLFDSANVRVLKGYHDEMSTRLVADGLPVPVNVRSHRRLDCAVFNFMYEAHEALGSRIDTARAAYVPTGGKNRVYKGSWISEETHIQICARNQKNILAVWHVREDGRYGRRTRS